MTDKTNSEELEWNLSGARTDLIADLTVEVRKDFKKASKHTTKGRVDNYLSTLETLYVDLRSYVENDELKNRVENKISSLNDRLGEDKPEEIFQDAKELDQLVGDIRVDLGLDISSKTKVDPENAAINGLSK